MDWDAECLVDDVQVCELDRGVDLDVVVVQ